ncbi:MAG: isopentenyl-diphosphate delta-isomerase [Saprospiraceae bacterium]|jgi:isopentenyl-diphosphate delta-isomerase
MANPVEIKRDDSDSNADQRKKDHIDLAFTSKLSSHDFESRFYYEPLLSHHPNGFDDLKLRFLDKDFGAPIWVSSMTGGTKHAANINKNLALACGEFGLGMGLGSCRQLLHSDEYFEDFDVRKYLNDQPLYANLGIAQVETLLENGQSVKIKTLLDKLDADGLIVHVNPLQEWLQPEGDRFKYLPIDTIARLLDKVRYKVIVKEVGQGMGPKSLRALMKLPLDAIEFAASGGTNFSLLELNRSSNEKNVSIKNIAKIGHNADEMVNMVNTIFDEEGQNILCKQFIISGGINDFLDGYYFTQKLKMHSIYGQASTLLKHALISYESIQSYIASQMQGLALAKAFLSIKE